MLGCSLRNCNNTRDLERIRRDLNRWKQQRGVLTSRGTFCIDESKVNAETDDEMVEIVMAINIANQNTHDQEADEEPQEEEDGILHSLLSTKARRHAGDTKEDYDILVIEETETDCAHSTPGSFIHTQQPWEIEETSNKIAHSSFVPSLPNPKPPKRDVETKRLPHHPSTYLRNQII